MRSRLRVACLAALAPAAAGCSRPPAPAPAAPAVATFQGGNVTAADIDRAILDLPAGQRQPADGDLLTWYERIARDLAMQAVLLEEARQGGLEKDPEFAKLREEARRQAVVAVYLEKALPPQPAPSAAEIEAYYRDHAKDFRSPPARLTYHLFRRVAPGADPAPVLAEVRRLRERTLAGEDFAALAAESSESESRHQKGLLGWVTPGKVAPDLERVIFSLEPRVPSQPLKTAAGVHLLWVASETPAKTLTFAEVRNAIGFVLAAESRQAAIDRLIPAAPADGFVPTADQLRGLFEAGDPAAEALRVGDYRLTLGQLQARLLAGQVGVTTGRDTPAHALVTTLERRERLYRVAVEKGIDRSPEAEARVGRLADRELAALQLRKRLAERIERDPKRLQDYYDANRSRFSTPLRLRVQRVTVPLKGDANQVMARLERSRPEVEAGRLDLARLAADLGGTLQDPAWELPSQVAQRERRPPAQAAGLKAGRVSPPYRTEDRIEMARVLERAEPEPQPLEKVRERVRTDLLVTQRQDEYASLVEETLSARRYAVVRPELEAMLKRAAAGP
jgi:parvulin-like peptidyl-prolyl isomerase